MLHVRVDTNRLTAKMQQQDSELLLFSGQGLRLLLLLSKQQDRDTLQHSDVYDRKGRRKARPECRAAVYPASSESNTHSRLGKGISRQCQVGCSSAQDSKKKQALRGARP